MGKLESAIIKIRKWDILYWERNGKEVTESNHNIAGMGLFSDIHFNILSTRIDAKLGRENEARNPP